MGFEITPRERRWFDAILVLGAIALGFIVLGFVNGIFTVFGDLIMVFFLAWLFAFMLVPVVNRVYSIPFMTRAGAIFAVYSLLFGSLVVVSILVAAALVNSISDFISDLPGLRANLPAILAPWQERLDAFGTQVDLLAQAEIFLENISQYALQLAVPLQQIAVASIGAIGNLLLVVVLSLYMVADRDRMVAFGFWLVPTGYKAEAKLLEEAVSRSFGGFIRGQVITGIVFGVICFAASVAFGLQFVAVGIVVGVGWMVVMNWLQPRIMATSLRIHPIVVLGSVLVGLKVAGIPGAIFGIPIAAEISALFLHALSRRRGNGPVAERAAARVGERQGRSVRQPREPNPKVDRDVEPAAATEPAPDE